MYILGNFGKPKGGEAEARSILKEKKESRERPMKFVDTTSIWLDISKEAVK